MELHIRGISKTYPNGVHALKDVTLTVPEGMYGLLGPNGAGKADLTHIIDDVRGEEHDAVLAKLVSDVPRNSTG